MGYLGNQTKPKEPDIDKDIDIDIEKDIDKDNGTDKEKETESPPTEPQFANTCRSLAKRFNKTLSNKDIETLYRQFDNGNRWGNWYSKLQILIMSGY